MKTVDTVNVQEQLPENVDIGRLITNISYGIRQYFDKMYVSYGITYPQSRVLVRLVEMSGKGIVNQRDLEYALGIKASSVSSLVRNLEQKGFVRCERQPQDTRNKSVLLTEKGYELENVLAEARHKVEALLVKDLSENESEILRSSLKCIMDNLDQDLNG